MKHYIIVKLNEQGKKQEDLVGKIEELFQKSLEIKGVHRISVRSSVIDLPNRYDLMICLEMEKESLALFDASEIHLEWKRQYSGYLESKAIFDCE